MDATIWLTAAAVMGFIGLSAFFSAAETSMTGASRPRLFGLEKDGDKAAARVNRLIERPDKLIGALLLGNNFLNTLAGSLTTALLVGLFGNDGVVIVAATAIVTILVLIFAEVLPKTYAFAKPDETAMRLSGMAALSVLVLAPIVEAVQWIVRTTLKVFGIRLDDAANEDTAREEIRGAIDLRASEGVVAKSDRDQLGGVLDLRELEISDVMIHRRNMRVIDADLPPRETVIQVLSSPHTRLPLYRDDAENIIGVLHAKDLLRALAHAGGDMDAVDVASVMREPWFVPETTGLQEQLNAFLKQRNHFALVVDEYGALKGLITLEDILEEIVGEIADEHDIAVQGVRPQPDGSVNVDGWVPIRDLNRAMDWNLPDEEAVTVAGLVIHGAQEIPEPGRRYAFHGYRFQVLRRQRNQITGLRVEPIRAGDAPDA
jgi:Mg2+/Co2+ transporter CorB